MRNQILVTFLFATIISCNKKAEPIEPAAVPDLSKPTSIVEGKQCYEFVKNKDTISLTLAMSGNNATGELAYRFFEKDKNNGTFSGVFIGDTLFADYTFESEGMKSIRETVFLRKGDQLIQGTGDMEEKDDKQVFKDSKKLAFDPSMTLVKTDCK